MRKIHELNSSLKKCNTFERLKLNFIELTSPNPFSALAK